MSCPRIGSIDKQNSKMQNHLHFHFDIFVLQFYFTIAIRSHQQHTDD
jgi:hypothetical protein